MSNILDRFKNAWSAFKDPMSQGNKLDKYAFTTNSSSGTAMMPDVRSPNRSTEKTFVNALYTRIAIDCAQCDIEHVIIDDQERYVATVKDGLNDLLNYEANIDQTGRSFRQELFYTLFTEGVIAAVPTLTDVNVWENRTFEIKAMRVGLIKEWKPDRVRIEAYNDLTGRVEQFWMPKYAVAIIPNPLAHVMNDPSSTLKRLIHKLNLLDKIDDQTGSGKLDMIIQLPYSLRSESKREWAAQRKKEIEDQVANSKLGIAYIDAAEHVTQINRSLENNLQTQVEYLTKQVYNQLGLTEKVFDGTAEEQEMLNYYNRTIEPILSFVTLEFKRKFLSKSMQTRGHSMMFFRDPFKLVPVDKLAELADKMTRNEIMSSNEFRSILGYRPSTDPSADELRNKNLNQEAGMEQPMPVEGEEMTDQNFQPHEQYQQ